MVALHAALGRWARRGKPHIIVEPGAGVAHAGQRLLHGGEALGIAGFRKFRRLAEIIGRVFHEERFHKAVRLLREISARHRDQGTRNIDNVRVMNGRLTSAPNHTGAFKKKEKPMSRPACS